jgi:hypothetical protein
MDALRVNDVTLRRELWQSIRSSAGEVRLAPFRERQVFAKPTVAEQRLLELLFADEELRATMLPRLQTDDFDELPTARLFKLLIELDQTRTDVTYENVRPLIEQDATSAEILPMLLMSEVPDGLEFEERLVLAERCIDALRLMHVDRRMSELRSQIADAERDGDEELQNRLALEHLKLARERGSLLPPAEIVEATQ